MIDLAEKIMVECYLCQRIIKKMKLNQDLSEAERYHIDVDLAAISKLRQHVSVISAT